MFYLSQGARGYEKSGKVMKIFLVKNILHFNTSIASLGTDERITKIRVSKCLILKFLWDFEKCQNRPKVNVERVDF